MNVIDCQSIVKQKIQIYSDRDSQSLLLHL